jgi:hypothetical protein
VNELADFLLARIAEDSELAVSAGRDAQTRAPITDDLPAGPDEDSRIAHMYRWSPARVLGECEGKRRIVEDYLTQLNSHQSGWDARAPRDYSLRSLSLAYADHPAYRDEWRP